MKKQFKNQIFKTVLLLLSVVLLVASAVVIAAAIDTAAVNNPKYLTLNFDTNQISSCTVYHEVGGEMVEHTVVTESGQTVAVESGVKVMVSVIPKNGLWPEFNIQGQVAQTEGCVVLWSSLKTDSVLTVNCTNREYIIHALDYDRRDINDVAQGELKIPYHYTVIGDGWTNSLLTSGAVKYRIDDKLELPAVNEVGEDFTFHGWYIITGSGDDDVHWIEADETDGKYYIPQSLTMNEYMYKQNGCIYVYPKLVFKSYVINRIDIVHDTSFPMHIETLIHRETMTYKAKELYSAIAEKFWSDDPTTGGYKQYLGYYFVDSCPATNPTMHPQTGQVLDSTENPDTTNVVYRFYQPIVYTLTYYDDDGTLLSFNGPSEYTYSQKTEIGHPSRTGYDFAGWKVQVYRDGQWFDEYLYDIDGKYFLGNGVVRYDTTTNTFENENVTYASEANETGEYEIRLTAQWEAIDITVKYEFGEGVNSSMIANASDFLSGGKFTSFKYNAGIIIDNPVRKGWKFVGWTVTYTDGDATPEVSGLSKVNGKEQYQLAPSIHAQNITLTANWEVETYTVVLDGQGADAGFTTQIASVQYGGTLVIPNNFVLPQKVGYNFDGYWSAPNGGGEQYIDKNGNSVDKSWNIDGEDGGTITLYAHWSIRHHHIIIPKIEKIPEDATIFVVVINGDTAESKPYYDGFNLPYGTEFRVEIQMPDGFKVVTWNDQDVDLRIDATEGNRQPKNVFFSASHVLGDADMTLIAVARPAAPAFGTEVSIEATKSETGIVVEILDASKANKYQVAILGEDGTLDWCDIPEGSNRYTFEGLNPGTYYDIYVRLRETKSTLAGVSLTKRINTKYDQHIENVKDILWDMLTKDENNTTAAWTVIDSIVDSIDKKAEEYPNNPPEEFYEWLEERIAKAEEQLVFARFQDSKIAILEGYYNACVASGSFTDENLGQMLSWCSEARALIIGASDENAINAIFEPVLAKMKAVRATYLHDEDKSIKLESQLGLNFGSSIQLNSVEDIKTLRRAIADAIAQGKITVYGSITIEEATKLLSALDTICAYNFSIVNVQLSEGDVFTITLKIPEGFSGYNGFQVVYFNQATGMVELLETTRKGSDLIFTAKYIADFAVLADPTVDLTGVIIALGAILLCQLIAIALVLIARGKAKNYVMHASVALPMFLTIHYLPVANAELIALGLGAAVLLAQIVLMWLLLSSGMIRMFKTKRRVPTQQEVTAVVREEDLHEDSYNAFEEESVAENINDDTTDEVVEEFLDEVIDEVFDELAEEFIEEANEETVEESLEESAEEVVDAESLDEEAFDEELAQELALEQEEEYTEEYLEEEYVEEYAEEPAEEYADEEPAEENAEEEYVGDESAEDEYVEEAYADEDEAHTDEDYVEEEYIDEEYVSEEYVDEEYADSAEEVIDETLPEELEEVYEGEELTDEEAFDDSYLTDEEENEYAFDEEEAERVSDAHEANQEIEETAYDTDPIAGVFGESDRQDGDSSNEGGDSWDADAYGESYEYGDETDAPYAETENADVYVIGFIR